MGVDRAGWPGDRTWIEVDVLRCGLWAGRRDLGASYDSFSASIDAETPVQGAHLGVLGSGHTPEKAQSTPQQHFLSFYSIDPWAFLRRTAFECFLESMGGVPYH